MALTFLLQRARQYWPVFLALASGVILATALLASGPILVDTVLEFGLQRSLLNAEAGDVHLRLTTMREPDAAAHAGLEREVLSFAQTRFGPYQERLVPFGATRYLYPWQETRLLREQRVTIGFYGHDREEFLEQVVVVAGRWPEETWSGDREAAVVIGESMAQALDLEVGDRLPLSTRQSSTEPEYWLQIAAVVRPRDVESVYWFGRLSPLRPQSDARYSAQHTALVPAGTALALAADWFRPSEMTLGWHLLLAPERVGFADLALLQAQLANLESANWEIGDGGLHLETGLGTTLADFAMRAAAVRSPLLALTAAVALLGLYYVAVAASLSLQQVEGDFAVLRGRGASGGQLFRLQLVEAGLLCLVAIFSGPLLARLSVLALSVWGPPAEVASGAWAVRLPSSARLAALAGGAASIAGLLLPVPALLRRTTVSHQHFLSRTQLKPWWQRFYLDVFVLLAGLILLWRFQSVGNIVGGAPDQPRTDWLLLLSPLALVVGVAAILLRLFPFVLDVIAQWISAGRALPATLAMWQAARDPGHVARLVLLLTLAMALGLFSSGLDSALQANEIDRARYATGGDLLIDNPSLDSTAALPSAGEVSALSLAWRAEGSLQSLIGASSPRFDLLAVDPETLPAVASFRPDFAPEPVVGLVEQLRSPAESALITLPAWSRRLGFWLWLSPELVEGFNFRAKVQTATGDAFAVRLELAGSSNGLESPELEGAWFYLDGPLPALADAVEPLRLHSLWIQSAHNRFWPETPLYVDDITVVDEGGQSTVVESFESDGRWPALTPPLETTIDAGRPRSGSRHLAVYNDDGYRPLRWYGVGQAADVPGGPAPALASRAFLEMTQLQIGDAVATWVDSVPFDFELVGIIDYFPTVYEEKDAGFLITSRRTMLERVNRFREAPAASNLILVDGRDELSLAKLPEAVPSLVASGTRVLEADAIQRNIRSDPLGLGLRSVSLFGYLLTLALALTGFATHFYLSIRQRRKTFGVLRALGLSPRQLYLTLFWEQLALIISGLLLGTILGLLLNRLALAGLPLELGDRPPVPPFLVQTDWTAAGRIYLTLSLSFLALLAVAARILRRSKLHRVLRVGEE